MRWCGGAGVWVGELVLLLPGGNRNLGQTPQRGGLGQTDEGHEGLVEEVHLPHQHVGGLSVPGDLLHELVLQLQDVQVKDGFKVTFSRSEVSSCCCL